jgi:1-deoxy-D-xylulose-5-phosphate synthase
MKEWRTPFKELEVGKGRCLAEGEDIAILSLGSIGLEAVKAIAMLDGKKPAHYDMRFLKPIDEELLHTVFKKFKKIITLEDAVISGGLGSAVLEFMAENNYSAQVKRLGVPDKFIEHGTQKELYKECCFDSESMYKNIINFS